MFELFRHLFLPHHTNNFRAKILHADFFVMYVVIFFVLSICIKTIYRINPSVLGFATDIRVEKLLELTNQKRQEINLNTLKLDSQLSLAAAAKANDMFAKNYWAHVAPDGTTPWVFINNSGYVYTIAGENLAKNFSNSDGVVEAWMNSPSHRENILRSGYQDVGFAVVNGVLNGEETTLVVQMFGARLHQLTESNTSTDTSVLPAKTVKAAEQPPQNNESLILNNQKVDVGTPAAATKASPVVLFANFAQSVIKQPLIDIPKLIKMIVLVLSSILILVLIIDAIFIWKHKIVRLGGKNIAHILFLLVICVIVWFISFGSII